MTFKDTPSSLKIAASSAWGQYSAPTRVPAAAGLVGDTTPPVLVILGEAPGAEEEAAGVPFVGASGRLLRRELFPKAGLDIDQWHILNVFQDRPPNNDLKLWTRNKTELKKEGISLLDFPFRAATPLAKRYLHPDYHWHLEELDARLRALKPDLIICLGATALWAISGESAIGTHRGTFFNSPYGLAIATYHPAAILRQWSNLPLAWSDLRKAARHLAGTLPPPLRREVFYDPTPIELAQVYARFLQFKEPLGVDIETCPAIGQITTISFATPTLGICIPIWDKAPGGRGNVYPTIEEELRAWRWIERFAKLPIKKVMQNGLYDSQYLLDTTPFPIRLSCWRDDTAILHHALQPELPKALGTLASVYLNEPSWKQMRTAKKDEGKADE